MSANHLSTTLSNPLPFLPIQTPLTQSSIIPFLPSTKNKFQVVKKDRTMATASATITVPAIVGPTRSSHGKTRVVKYINGLNSFGGLKANNNVVSLGLPVCTEQSFAKIVSSLKKPSQGRRGNGGALTSTCSAIAEIFRIAAIMPGLVLVGVAVGFVLLRIEASVEEE